MKGEATPSGSDDLARSEAAETIALEATRLARIATANDFQFLAQLIDMVVAEAWREATEPQVGGRGETVSKPAPSD